MTNATYVNDKEYIVTYDGRKIPLDQIKDQHLCNIIHYCKYVGISPAYLIYADKFETMLQERLQGKLMPYRPPVDNLQEMFELKRKGYLRREGDTLMIMKEGNYLGEVVNNNAEKFQIIIDALN